MPETRLMKDPDKTELTDGEETALHHHANSGTIKTTLSFAVTGTFAVGTDKAPTMMAPCNLTLSLIHI